MKTIDGGNNWIKQSSNTTESLNGVFFLNNQVGVVVGSGGTILKTKDGGTNWYSQQSNSTNHLSDVHFFDTSMGCAVGTNRTIRTTTTVVEWPLSINKTDLSEFDINVYPNPSINEIKISSEEIITAYKIFNSTGKLVLSQEVRGNKMSINTSEFSSGTYYLLLKSNSKTSSQKITVK